MKTGLTILLLSVLFISLSAQEESSKYKSVIISPKTNVIYKGIDNLVEIKVAGVSNDKISVSVSGGTLSKTDSSKYYIKPDVSSVNVTLSVAANVNGKKISAGVHEFAVKIIPDPIAMVGGYKGGNISKNTLMVQKGITIGYENSVLYLNYTITGFTVSANTSGYSLEARSNSGNFTPEQLNIIKKLNSGDKVYFENIRAKGPDGKMFVMASFFLKIN
jgi:hypothetical protein